MIDQSVQLTRILSYLDQCRQELETVAAEVQGQFDRLPGKDKDSDHGKLMDKCWCDLDSVSLDLEKTIAIVRRTQGSLNRL
jgi:hypothetical protein